MLALFQMEQKIYMTLLDKKAFIIFRISLVEGSCAGFSQ